MFGPIPLINFIRWIIKLPDNLWNVLHTDIYDGIPYFFAFVWPCFGLDTQRGNKPLFWSSQIIFWIWRCDYHLVQTTKLQQYFQGGVFITTLDLSVFSNIVTTTFFLCLQLRTHQVWNSSHLWNFPPRTSSKWSNHDK